MMYKDSIYGGRMNRLRFLCRSVYGHATEFSHKIAIGESITRLGVDWSSKLSNMRKKWDETSFLRN